MNEWHPGLRIEAGAFTDGVHTGTIFSADFEENEIEINLGEGLFWKGTSQQFYADWEKI